MSTFRLEINVPGFNEARNSPGVREALLASGRRIADAAAAGNDGEFEVIDAPSKTRARVVVVTADAAAKRAEAEYRALTRAFDAGRG